MGKRRTHPEDVAIRNVTGNTRLKCMRIIKTIPILIKLRCIVLYLRTNKMSAIVMISNAIRTIPMIHPIAVAKIPIIFLLMEKGITKILAKITKN